MPRAPSLWLSTVSAAISPASPLSILSPLVPAGRSEVSGHGLSIPTLSALHRARAGVAGARSDQRAGLVLLDRMRDPADRTANDKQAERCANRQAEGRGRRREREIDILVPAGQPARRGDRLLDPSLRRRQGGARRREQSAGTRIALGIERE